MNIDIFPMCSYQKNKGIFFRLPVQEIEVNINDFFSDEKETDISNFNIFIRKFENSKLFRFGLSLINNIKEVKRNIKKIDEDINLAGIYVNVWCWPIYFNRLERKSVFYIIDHPFINKIISWGYENYLNRCNGNCKVEYTTIYFHNENKIKFKTYGSFNFIYSHKIEEYLKNQWKLIEVK